MKTFYDVNQLLERWTFGDIAARELRWELDAIHGRIDAVEESVRKLARAVDLAVVDGKLTAMQGARGQVEAALDYQLMSSYAPAAEVSAAAAANTLRSWYYYEMPTATWPRFEPWVATISFVEAVTAWLALRAANNQPLDDTLRAKLHGYAGHLEEVAVRTRDSVGCRRGCGVTQVPGICLLQNLLPGEAPPPCPEEAINGSYFSCSDGITRTTENFPWVPLSCPAHQWEESLPDLAQAKVEERYAPQEFERLAALWRRIASQ